MPTNNSPVHYPITLRELIILRRSSYSDPARTFVTNLRKALRYDPNNNNQRRTAEVYTSNSVHTDLRMYAPIGATGSWDMYSDDRRVRARAGAVSRLHQTVLAYNNLSRSGPSLAHHRPNLRGHYARVSHQRLNHAKSLLARLEDNAMDWYHLHRTKECWRKALVRRAPKVCPYITHLSPPAGYEYLNLQIQILEGWACRVASNSYMMDRIALDPDSWQDALCRLIPGLKQYIQHFEPPMNDEVYNRQTRLILRAVHDVPRRGELPIPLPIV
ncbi:unnamed protein product [Peniophora sp. CBMAI 1063]|nr:unnamed protein product [Peniophora sp. CBMAI 1063]